MKKSILSRRNFFNKTFAAGIAPFIMPKKYFEKSFFPAQNTNPNLDNKKVLFVYGGWPGHKPKEAKDLFVPWFESEGAKITLSENLDVYADFDTLIQFDLIVQVWTMGKISEKQFKGLSNAISKGVGFTGWHGGLADSFRGDLGYQAMVGGMFTSHPGGHKDFDVKIVDNSDYITSGINDFKVTNSEQYYMLIDPNVKVLATTEFTKIKVHKFDNPDFIEGIEGSIIPAIWKKYHGKGRIFYSSIGHHLKEFEIPELFEIQKRGMRWASESKYHPFENCISPIYA
ncbi:MAG: ThuA domain-containing protein [Flavobacteriaceae bacterium]|nr:ThuA domain-containing protein [Flavobacteriaceae bacterium]